MTASEKRPPTAGYNGYAERGHHDCGCKDLVGIQPMQAELPKDRRRGRSIKPRKRPTLWAATCAGCGRVRIFAYKPREQLHLELGATPAPAAVDDQAQMKIAAVAF